MPEHEEPPLAAAPSIGPRPVHPRNVAADPMRLLSIRSTLAAVLFGFLSAIPFVPTSRQAIGRFALELRLQSEKSGYVQVYYDIGAGFNEADSARFPITRGTEPAGFRFPLPAARVRALRIDPINNDGTVTLERPRVLDDDGREKRVVGTGELEPLYEIETSRSDERGWTLRPVPGAQDPQLLVRFQPPLDLREPTGRRIAALALHLVPVPMLVIALLLVLDRSPALRSRVVRLYSWMAAHPQTAILGIAALAAIAATYPVVFFGQSFTSPNLVGPVLLYDRVPTLPGYTDTRTEDPMGADVGAIAWHHHPLSIIEHRALFRDGELPLWNRYDAGGVPLLGQGQSMFGDPLHLLPVIANGAAWAWDVKYVIARCLFGCGLGIVVWRLTRHTTAAFVTAFSSVFIGFFVYRLNHPAYFSMCYAPWILVGWTGLMKATTRRQTACGVAALVVACWCELTSGTAKEAYMLLIGMNFTGLLMAGCADVPWSHRLRTIAWSALAGVVFVLLGAPVWLTFLDALGKSYTSYNNPTALQIWPTLVLGLFDELFYRPIHALERVWNPSANFLVLGGVLFLLATWRRTGPDRARLALVLGALPAFALAFGLIPPAWIIQIPFLGNVGHIDNTFSCVLIVHLIVLAGLGYRNASERLRGTESGGDIFTAALLGIVPVVAWLGLTHTVHREPFGGNTTKGILRWGEHLPVSGFVWGSLVAMLLALVVLTLIYRWVLRRGGWTASTAILAAACVLVLLWRHGQQLPSNFDRYVYNPATRVDFHARSAAIDYLQKNAPEPARAIGFDGNLFPGWSGAYAIESTNGPDAVVSPHYREMFDGTSLSRQWDWVVFPRVENIRSERPVYDFLNVRFYLDLNHTPAEISSSLEPRFSGDLNVYSSPTTWPRAFFTNRLAWYESPPELGRLIREGDGRPFAAMQLRDKTLDLTLPTELGERTVHAAADYHVTTNTTSFSVHADGPGMIVLQENWFARDFRVTMNGEPTKYLRVNHAFKGIPVSQAGDYRVSFTYRPEHFTLALGMAFSGAVTLLMVLGWGLRDRPSA